MRIAYLDCFAGISGDMLLGALVDAGVPWSVFEDAVAALALGASLRVSKVDRSGISSTKVDVLEGGRLAEAESPHTHEHKHHGHGDDRLHSHEPAHSHNDEHAHGTDHRHAHADVEKHAHVEQHEQAHIDDHEDAHGHSHEHSHEHKHEDPQPPEHEYPHPHTHGRSLSQIRELIYASGLAESVKEFAVRTFEVLGKSEAKIHNVPVDRIHFHEVGAVDAIVDIVCAAAGVDYLETQGPLCWFCSSINVGGGMVECAHGTFPVPAPATADLLRGMPTYSAHVQKELVTPTGAALLRALAPEFGAQPAMRIDSIGYGAGTRNPDRFPNVLRLSLGEAADAVSTEHVSTYAHAHTGSHAHEPNGETVVVLETAIDDANPQLLADVAERALGAGALDVMLTPVVMKKGRAATLFTVLANPEDAAGLERLLLRETTTLGLRMHREQRSCLERRHEIVSTEYGDIRVKIGSLGGEDLNVAPEFEDCRAASLTHSVPVKQVLQAAVAAYIGSKTPVASS